MAPRTAAGIGLALLGIAAAQFGCGGSGGSHGYVLRVYKVANQYKIDVDGVLKTPANDRFELDFGGTITWEIDNQTGGPLALRIDGFGLSSQNECPVKFTFGGADDCAGERLNIANGANPRPFIQAVAEDMAEEDYFPSRDHYTFQFRVGPNNTPNTPVDPELEIERDFGFIEDLLAALAALVGSGFLTWWWLRRKGAAQ
jgi:hypothetical protein